MARVVEVLLDNDVAKQNRIKHETSAAEQTIQRWTIELDEIMRSLDEALGLLDEPYRLYAEAPEGINLRLTAVVFEKVWILNDQVLGAEMKEPYLELLTLDARLAHLQERTETGQRPSDGPGERGEVQTHYRRARGLEALLRGLSEAWPRLGVERPRGALPLEARNPASGGDRVPTCIVWSG